MTTSLLDALAERVLLIDGAMGTQLQLAGLEPGECGEAWNLERPERVLEIQRTYVAAGSDCLLTNTFGASRLVLERHGRGAEASAINRAGAELAREAFGERTGFVLGDVGPFGGLLEPLGEVPGKEVRRAFGEQARALVEGGVDAILVETQTSLEELGLGIAAAQEAGAPCVIGSVAFDLTHGGSDYHTMMGVSPEQAAELMQSAGADVVGLNCGTKIDMRHARAILERYRTACDLPTLAQPNAGQPELEGRQIVYRLEPEAMAAGVPGLIDAGARLIGGCCGSTPRHIESFRAAIDRDALAGERA
ncbi:MAG: homocysteine methyltransferase [bacterium]|nr:homocysteine methyltransferase [bacterium]